MIKDIVKAFVAQHQLIEKNKTVLVGVSGGPDSMALLHYLKERKEIDSLHIIAIGIDHQLRRESSEADMLYVEAQCKKWRIPFVLKKVNVRAYKQKNKIGTQLAARTLRYQVFSEVMLEYDADYLALAHHGDDQIETMLMGMMRMTSIQGLKGIPFKRDFSTGVIIRPFLPLTKSDIEAYCQQHQIDPRIDLSNFETDYTRNELRLDVVPILKTKNERLHETIQHLSETVQEDEFYLLEQALTVMHDVVQIDEKKQRTTILLPQFHKQPVSLQRRLFRLTLDYLYEENVPEKISYTHEEIFLYLAHDATSSKQIDFPNGLTIEKSYNQIHFYFKRAQGDSSIYKQTMTETTNQVDLPNGDRLRMRRVDKVNPEEDDMYTFIYPEADITFPLHIRHRRAGDRMSYRGLNGSKKLKDIFIDEKIPRHERDKRYVLTDDEGEVLWLIGIRKKAINTKHKRDYIVIDYIRMNN